MLVMLMSGCSPSKTVGLIVAIVTGLAGTVAAGFGVVQLFRGVRIDVPSLGFQ